MNILAPEIARLNMPPSPPPEVVFIFTVAVIHDIAPVSENSVWPGSRSTATVCWIVPRIWYFRPFFDCPVTSGTVGRSGMLMVLLLFEMIQQAGRQAAPVKRRYDIEMKPR